MGARGRSRRSSATNSVPRIKRHADVADDQVEPSAQTALEPDEAVRHPLRSWPRWRQHLGQVAAEDGVVVDTRIRIVEHSLSNGGARPAVVHEFRWLATASLRKARR
jgi:hypothetical protein